MPDNSKKILILAGCVLVFAAWFFAFVFPYLWVGSGVDEYEGRQTRSADEAYGHTILLYGDGFLDDHSGPGAVLGWHVEDVRNCPGTPSGPSTSGWSSWEEATAREWSATPCSGSHGEKSSSGAAGGAPNGIRT